MYNIQTGHQKVMPVASPCSAELLAALPCSPDGGECHLWLTTSPHPHPREFYKRSPSLGYHLHRETLTEGLESHLKGFDIY